MKHDSLSAFLRRGFVAVGFFAASILGAATVGEPAPAFTLTDLDGTSHSLSDFKGKTVVLEWVNPECPFVVKHYEKSGNIPATQKAATADGVIWLQINSAASGKQGDYDVAEAKEWLSKTNAAATAYLRDANGVVGKAYGAVTTPQIFVINSEGTLVYNGAIDDKPTTNAKDIDGAENFAKAALAALKSGQPVAKSQTKPYGCSVKY